MNLRKLLKKVTLNLFEIAQIFGFYITPKHYYVPLASTRALRASRAKWNHPFDMSPVNISLSEQIEIAETWIAPYEPEYSGNAVFHKAVLSGAGPGYGYIEAQALHGMLRKLAPRRVIEVGSGVSTMCMLAATHLNESEGRGLTEVTCIEPHPSDLLRHAKVRLIEQYVEDVDLEIFDQLQLGDLLFIDSSHAVRPCGDVVRLYLEILPRLNRGVIVHIHDIFFPYLFQRNVDRTYMQWMETALLAALLFHSPRYRVMLCLSQLHYSAPEILKRVFPEYSPQPNDGGLIGMGARQDGTDHFPASIYIQVN
jgi:predicted O-methyltransferase YrrM